ncbi:hypothetical protein HMI54_007054 [Coelomomyces lativittatus]|nr:hypothetical protein HMI54_007054 [Coelomomyces lativittatus]
MSNPKIERQIRLDQYTTEVNSLEAKAEALKTNAEKHLYQLSLLNEKYLELHEKRQRIHFLREKAETLKQKLAQGNFKKKKKKTSR